MIVFSLQNLMNRILMNETWKNHELLLDTEFIFYNNPKVNEKKNSYWVFVEGTVVMLTSSVAYKYTSSLQDWPLWASVLDRFVPQNYKSSILIYFNLLFILTPSSPRSGIFISITWKETSLTLLRVAIFS